MIVLADVVLRTAIPVAAALVAVRWSRRRSAAFRHRVLVAGLFAAAAVLPVTALTPAWEVALPRPSA
jgi:hypothetical protein